MKKIWVHKAKSFKDADEFDRKYYLKMSSQERLDIMQQLRRMYYKFSKGQKTKYGHRIGLRRVVRIVEQAQG